MKFSWNPEKNLELKSDAHRNVCFEDIVAAIEGGGLLDELKHPNAAKYPHQRILVVQVSDYVYSVPCVPTEGGLFLKTVFPSRRFKQIYLPGEINDDRS